AGIIGQRPAVRDRWSGFPRIPAAATSKSAAPPRPQRARRPAIRESAAWRWFRYSLGHSLCLAGVIAPDDGDEQIGDAGRAHLAEYSESLTLDVLEQQDAAAQPLPLLYRLERPRCRELVGIHPHFPVACLHFFHAAVEN